MYSKKLNKSFFADVLETMISNNSTINEIIADAAKDNVFVESIRLNTNTLDPYLNCLITISVDSKKITHCVSIHVIFTCDFEEAMNVICKELCDFIEKEIEKRDELFFTQKRHLKWLDTPIKMA